MKRASKLIFVFLTFFAWPSPQFAGEAAETDAFTIPDIGLFGTSEQGSRPTWIAADALDANNGSLEQLSDVSRFRTRGYLKAAQRTAPDCFLATEVHNFYVGTPDRSTFYKAVTTAEQIVSARVIEARIGFFGGTPGTLFAVEIGEILRGNISPSTHFFFWPVGRLDFNSSCIEKVDGRVLASPKVGDEVLLLATDAYAVADAFLHLQKASDLILRGTDDKATLQESIGKNSRGQQIIARRSWQGTLEQIRSWLDSIEHCEGEG